ncbi:MAG: twin-arginine translocation signal domain-containing protein [Planctomycetota bacterium]
MFQCQPQGCCHGCCHPVDRRHFLKRCGAAAVAAAGSLTSFAAIAAEKEHTKARIAAVFLMSMNTREIWPYPDFDTKARQREVLARLREGCPKIELVPVTVENAADMKKVVALKNKVDGYLVYTMTLDWNHRKQVVDIAGLGKPTLVADEFLGGSGVFLTGYGALYDSKIPAAAVSSTRLSDLIMVVQKFEKVHKQGTTPAQFAQQCEQIYRRSFQAEGKSKCLDDPVPLTDIHKCVERFRRSSFLIIGRGQAGQEHDFLGVKGRYIDFDELQSHYEKIDREKAAEWANRWSKQADDLPPADYVEPSRPTPDAIQKAGGVYLAMCELIKKYGTDSVTMNCLGGFAAGKLPAYPCLGFRQLLNDGGQGVCEAMPDDTISMLMARILTGRPGFVSDPALDTSKNQVVYAHCVGTTKVFGRKGKSNGYRIRTLHNRDPRGACAESFMPPGYMTTTFRTNVGRKKMVIHQAKAIGTLDSEKGCRTKLIAEVRGDIGKLFNQWSQFGWHRVTVYGDVSEPLAEFGKALGLEIVEET